MGRKKKKDASKPWCYYCERDFDDESVLIQHQAAKHFKCHECHKKLGNITGLVFHLLQVHKLPCASVPNAKSGRERVDVDVMGMRGIPADAAAEHAARTNPPVDGNVTKKQKLASSPVEDDEEEEEEEDEKAVAVAAPAPRQAIAPPAGIAGPFGISPGTMMAGGYPPMPQLPQFGGGQRYPMMAPQPPFGFNIRPPMPPFMQQPQRSFGVPQFNPAFGMPQPPQFPPGAQFSQAQQPQFPSGAMPNQPAYIPQPPQQLQQQSFTSSFQQLPQYQPPPQQPQPSPPQSYTPPVQPSNSQPEPVSFEAPAAAAVVPPAPTQNVVMIYENEDESMEERRARNYEHTMSKMTNLSMLSDSISARLSSLTSLIGR